MRKKLLLLAMLPLLILSVLSGLGVNIVPVSAVTNAEDAVIEVSPDILVNEAFTEGTEFILSISTDYNGSDIWGYEFTLTYNPVVLDAVNVTNGGVIVNGTGDSGAKFQPGTIDNEAGKLSVTTGYFFFVAAPDVNVTTGPGILARVGFIVTGIGDSDITLGVETRLIGMNTGTGEDYIITDDATPTSGHILNGYFANTKPVHNVKVTGVWANETLVFSGQPVNVTVEVENAGNVTEKFDVTAYYGTLPIGTETIIRGASLPPKNVSFIWDTTPARGPHVISAEASVVGSAFETETSTTDNTYDDGTVRVRPPILALVNSTGGNEIIDITHTAGDTFTVNINITDAYELSSAVFNLTWRTGILTATSIVTGTFFTGTTSFTYISSNYNNTKGINMTTTFINYSRTDGGTNSGNGTLATFNFEVVSRGGSLLELVPSSWWTDHWKTTPVVVSGVYSNKYDMDFHPPGNYLGRTWVYPDWTTTLKITVNPINNGFLHLTYNLTIYANGTVVDTEVLTLVGKQNVPDNKRTYTFDWNFTGADWGLYPITANITDIIPNLDDNPDNNDYVFGTPVTVRIPGDTDGSANVTFTDFITFAADYGKDEGEAGYDEVSDLTGDGSIDFADFIKFAAKYGQSTTSY